MIHYHGTPIGGPHDRAAESLLGRHAFVSFAAPSQLEIVVSVCQSFAVDNGAFSAWRSGKAITDWAPFYEWVAGIKNEPTLDFALIPDVIDGTEREQDDLVEAWPYPEIGVPVWHMNEDVARLVRLCSAWSRVAIGSTGAYKDPGSSLWWSRMADAMNSICVDGKPPCKLHGLRMLDPGIFCHLPLASADSTSAAFNSHVDAAWNGTYEPPKAWRTRVLMARIEAWGSARSWESVRVQQRMFA